ncbi:hypothetical protein RF55_25515 [Lasius niger]|uniref:Uncharacterized protein n=1 Tax=Lasius niger TaxID=67767 RepID=A0A0J7JV34_LASNI|nr:hypothetical protein RF55_25515 [Lasius niger]
MSSGHNLTLKPEAPSDSSDPVSREEPMMEASQGEISATKKQETPPKEDKTVRPAAIPKEGQAAEEPRKKEVADCEKSQPGET